MNASEPAPPAGTPSPPPHLDAAARAEWDRISPILAAMNVLSPADGPALAIYCAAFSQEAAATKKVQEQGMLIPQGTGSYKINPHVAIANQARQLMLRVLAEFGCTPSSRSKVSVQVEEKDPLADLINRRRKNA